MSMWIGSSEVPFSELGMTEEKFNLLKNLSGNSGYWMKAHAFVKAITYRKLSSLSDFQRRWLTTIIMDLETESYRKSWRY